MAQMVKRLPTMWETQVQFLGWEDVLEKEMATHSSVLAWKFPWTVEPGYGLQTTDHGVTKSWTQLSDFTFTFQYSCLENSMDRGVWQATVHGIAKELDTLDLATKRQQQ